MRRVVDERAPLPKVDLAVLAAILSSSLDITIEHAGVPGLMVGDCVEYQNGIDYRDNVMVQKCIVMEMSVSSLSPMCMTQTKLRII